MKIAYWDIETHDLNGAFGPILCASILSEPDGKMKSFRQDEYVRKGLAEDMLDDRQICVDLRDYLETFHVTCGWFSKGFDITMLNTRLAKWGERLLKPMLHLDGIWYFKGWRGLKAKSAKLADVSGFFGFEPKPEVDPETWLMARHGKKKAMDVAVKRCEADVRITKQCIEKALDLELVKNIQRYP